MMTQRIVQRAGEVQAINGDIITVKLFSQKLPKSCVEKSCTMCASMSPESVRTYPREVFASAFSVGSVVRVSSLALNDGLAAAIVFMVPLISAILVYVLVVLLTASETDTWYTVLSALVGLVFGFLIVIGLDRHLKKKLPVSITIEE